MIPLSALGVFISNKIQIIKIMSIVELSPSAIVLNSKVVGDLPFTAEQGCNQNEYLAEPGKEHYRLLAYLSTFFNGQTILDIGTHQGSSAAALCYNQENVVHTFDIVSNILVKKPNCIYHTLNLWETHTREEYKNLILSSPLIFLDIDPHHGIMEFEFYEWLVKHDYKGTLIFDDILHFEKMRENLWFKIHHPNKIDLTSIGHWSGTGVVDFSKRIKFE
jgi:hypothetical protein